MHRTEDTREPAVFRFSAEGLFERTYEELIRFYAGTEFKEWRKAEARKTEAQSKK